MASELRRDLTLIDAVVIGMAAMIGAGIFVALAPAARAAGGWLPAALVVAGLIAYGNALSSARLAAIYPASGGTYVYGRERLGNFWGYLAGWAFVVGKTASCAAMALTVGSYLWPAHRHAVAVAAVLALTAVNYLGVQKSALVTRVIVVAVLAVLTLVAVVAFAGNGDPADAASVAVTPVGVLQAAGLLFFAFAGYARIATLGEEVRDPARTIPLAIPIALGVALTVYGVITAAALTTLGPAAMGSSPAPLVDVVDVAGHPELAGVVRGGAAVAAMGALLTLILGVSRTVLAMARDRHLSPAFASVRRAELVVGAAIATLAAVADVRAAIGFSSFGVLIYYAIANASALTLRDRRALPAASLLGCLLLAFTLPGVSVLAGLGVLAAGAVWFWIGRSPDAGARDSVVI